MYISNVPAIPLHNLLWVTLGVAFVVWLIISAIFFYHWKTYTQPHDPRIVRIRNVYLIGSFILFVSAASFIFSI